MINVYFVGFFCMENLYSIFPHQGYHFLENIVGLLFWQDLATLVQKISFNLVQNCGRS